MRGVLWPALAALQADFDPIKHISREEFEKRFSMSKKLAIGGFSKVYLATDRERDQQVALKFFDLKSSRPEILNELEIHQRLQPHRHIVHLLDCVQDPTNTAMVLEFVRGGELFDYIVKQGSFSEAQASSLLRQICVALSFMHDRGVTHRDIKPENVLLSEASKDAVVKLADFGLSRIQYPGEKLIVSRHEGTWAYWAPEIIKRKPQDSAVDMWAFGLLVYILLTGYHPFDPSGNGTNAQVLTRISNGQYDTAAVYQELSESAKDLIAHLLEKDPNKRYTAKQALNHPWLRGLAPVESQLPQGHRERLQGYLRLQELRAHIFAVMISVAKDVAPTTTSAIQRALTSYSDVLEDTFRLFDKDNSGFISEDELARVFESLGHRLSE